MRKNSRDKIVDSAVYLFNTKGYSGTSIRDIAAKAKVNAANIAYYFNNKNGLLEYCFTVFFENYLKEVEEGFAVLDDGAEECLQDIVDRLMKYQCENLQLTRFVLREMTIDSQMVREVMSTYMAKERYYLKKVLETGMNSGEFSSRPIHYAILQLKSLLNMPFLNSDYVSEVLHILPNENYFAEKYSREVASWLRAFLCGPAHPHVMRVVSV
ncbi:forespore capture DNA-binding protein RefZ [Mesobacillus zeae]|uniref:TetR/AcrR family transcriptional regulator n=1 Tax=Mesobacillus zeae TaxID=1917180 RepID=A0A398B1C7_9BACI|nr:forespore capture DNA-binding protein RefZ [Mesobacillus zeae]RID83124.1 TetR/AcrR family transcriptional regulator [Mesobacillus zeae]